MFFRFTKYSDLIKPMSLIIDVLVINLFVYFLPININEPILFHAYITLCWVVLSLKNDFYKIHRFTKVPFLLRKIFTQFIFFFFLLYAFIGFFKQPYMSRFALAQYFFIALVAISGIKFITYVVMMEYREKFKGNIRRVVVIGKNRKTDQLINVFKNRDEYGYEFKKQFCPKKDLD